MTRTQVLLLAFSLTPLALYGETKTATTPPRAAEKPAPVAQKKAERPRIDVAFCIDTTGSMGPFIEATKKRVWEIANGLLKGTPRPIVRMAVVAFRDRSDSYVVRKIDLTEDIDAVHKFLMQLSAGGGGDHPEHVTAGLRACVDDLTWSQGKRILKSIYLIGDAPAHTDYDDGDFHPVAKKAVSQGINIHTLACAGNAEVAQWMEIARMSDGQFHNLGTARTVAQAIPPSLSGGAGVTHSYAVRTRGFVATKSEVGAPAVMAPGRPAESLSAADAEGASAPALAGEAAPSVESALSDKILNSIKTDAKRKGVSSY